MAQSSFAIKKFVSFLHPFFMSREKVSCQKINKRVACESRCLKLKKRLLLGSSPSCLSPTWGGGEDVRSRSNHRRGFHRRPTTPFTCIWSRSSGTTPTRCSRSRSSGRAGAKASFTRGLRYDRKKRHSCFNLTSRRPCFDRKTIFWKLFTMMAIKVR